MQVFADPSTLEFRSRCRDGPVERRSWGMSRVVLETSAHWTDALEFYVRCGFTQTHFEPGTFGPDAWFEMKLDRQLS